MMFAFCRFCIQNYTLTFCQFQWQLMMSKCKEFADDTKYQEICRKWKADPEEFLLDHVLRRFHSTPLIVCPGQQCPWFSRCTILHTLRIVVLITNCCLVADSDLILAVTQILALPNNHHLKMLSSVLSVGHVLVRWYQKLFILSSIKLILIGFKYPRKKNVV